MSVLIDTNILLRSAQPAHPLCSEATHAVASLLKQNETVFFCPQNIAEFWNVATRPVDANGLGFSHAEVLSEVGNIEGLLTLLPDSPSIYAEWKRLVNEHKVRGIKVFDARLVAVANSFGVGSILTFNAADFRRYGNITVLDPASVLAGS
jgi:predicted nucleic acid-binding protein